MPKRDNLKPGKRVSMYLPQDSLKVADQIDNLSGFLQMALEQASAIMAFDIVRQKKGAPNPPPPTQEQVDRWNTDHPLDPLTAKRLGKEKINGQQPPSITGNSALDN